MLMKSSRLAGAAAAVAAAGAATAAYAAQPFIGTQIWTAATFCPAGWAQANGQLLPISENEALFALIGTTYGGDGETTFGLPDLRGRIPVHTGTGPGLSTYQLGEQFGSEVVTLTSSNLPSHTHAATTNVVLRGVSAAGQTAAPAGNVLASSTPSRVYSTAPSSVDMGASALAVGTTTVTPAGSSQPLDNMQPTLALKACIALFGVFPTQN